ncbi:MAG: ABC transporter permease [Woeseiaceae bacterium]
MQAIFHEMRQALSQLRHSPGFTSAALLILACGLGATMFMFTAVKAYMLTPLPYAEADRIMHLERANPADGVEGMEVPQRDYVEWRRVQQSFEALAAFYTSSVNLSGGDMPERVDGAFVTPSAFDVVRTEAHIGRTLMPADAVPGAPPVIVLGYGVWLNRYNGDPAILGENIRVNGRPVTVVGVMRAGFRFPVHQDVWVPLRNDLSAFVGRGEGKSVEVVGRLRPAVTLEQARAEFANIAAALAERHPENRNVTASIKPFQHEFVDAGTRTIISTMFAAVVFVLLIACSNVANLILARTAARQKDIALRVALGASRRRVLTHVLTESLVLALGGAVLGYFLAELSLDLTQRAFVKAEWELPFWVVLEVDWRVLLFATLTAVAAGVIAGLPPALRATRTDVNEHLKEGFKGSGTSASRLSRALVTAEIALSCILLVCSGLTIKSVVNIGDRPLGVENMELLMGRIGLPEGRRYPDGAAQYRYFEQLIQRLQVHADVFGATAASSYPGIQGWLTGYRRRGMEGSETGQLPLTQYAVVMDNYADTLGLRLMSGRWFDEHDAADSMPVAIVDARFAAEAFPGEDPIGRQIALGDPDDPDTDWRTIVGVAEAMFMDGLDDPVRPAALVPLRQEPYHRLTVAVHTRGDPLAFAQSLRETVAKMDKDVPVYWMSTYDNWIWGEEFPGRLTSTLFSIFAAIAVVLAAAGIYAVLAYTVSQRTREIGVRRAMGAMNGRILGAMLGQSLLQLGIGLGVGLVCAVLFARLLSVMFVGVSPFDPPTLITVALILCTVAIFASLLPALRALRVNPLEALRHE